MAGLLLSLPPTITAHAQLPSLGDGSDMTLAEERKLGDQIARELYRDPDFIDDPVIQEYVQDIWDALRNAARLRGELPSDIDERFAWQILLGKDHSINAFALPGGYFGLHLGLVGVVTSRDELASVMAHELSHVTQRHISRLMAQQAKQTPLMLGAMVLGALAASKSPNAASALIVGGQAAAMQNQLNFSRDMEREADRIGLGVMSQAGFESLGFVTMFEKLQHAARMDDNAQFPYLRSHPLTTQRIADMQSRIPASNRAVATPPIDFANAMIAARARVLSEPGIDKLRAWVSEAKRLETATQTASEAHIPVLYAAALASAQQRNYSQAKTFAKKLGTLVSNNKAAARLVQLLMAEIDIGSGDAMSGLADLEGLKTARPELILRSQAGLQLARKPPDKNQAGGGELGSKTALGDLDTTVSSLQAWTSNHPQDAQAWQLLGQAYQAYPTPGEPLRAIRADAESHAARLDYSAAVDRLRAAQQLARSPNQPQDYMDVSIVDARLKSMEILLKQQLSKP